jgi:hypothetical protein
MPLKGVVTSDAKYYPSSRDLLKPPNLQRRGGGALTLTPPIAAKAKRGILIGLVLDRYREALTEVGRWCSAQLGREQRCTNSGDFQVHSDLSCIAGEG